MSLLMISEIICLSETQVNLFKKGFGVGVPGNQHDNTYAQEEIQRQIVGETGAHSSKIWISCILAYVDKS